MNSYSHMQWTFPRPQVVGIFAQEIMQGYDAQGVLERAAGCAITFAEIREAVIASTPPGVWRLQLLQSLDSTARAMIE